MTSDGDLMRLSVARPALLAELYERHGPVVARYVVRRVGAGPAEDLAAEVFVRAFRARERYRSDQPSALPWLLGVANHVIADYRRIERRRLGLIERLVRSTPRVVEHDDRQLSPELVRELRRLPATDRDTLLLVVWGELSYEEAASALDVPVGTISSRISRARRQLARALGTARAARPSLEGQPDA